MKIDDLSCGNCKKFCDVTCPEKERIDDDQIIYYPADYYCDSWEYDNLRQWQRNLRQWQRNLK